MTKTQGELLAVGYVSGEMKILNKFGKVEKSFQAHKGAVTCIKWSHDGQTIASAGEEGTVKVESFDADLVEGRPIENRANEIGPSSLLCRLEL